MGLVGVVVVAGIAYTVFGSRSNATAGASGDTRITTGAVAALPARSLGKSGLPLPVLSA